MIPKAIKKGGEVENKENLNEKPTYEQWFNQIKFNTVGGYILPDGTKGIGKKSNESWFKKLYNNRFGEKENLKGGVADKKTIEQIAKEQGIENMFYVYNQLKKGISVEMEHTTDKDIAKEIALDHLSENMDYYIELEKMEKKLETEKKTKTQETETKQQFESEGHKEGKGKLYEFFTPQLVADKMVELAYKHGFKSGNVLEPSAGNGRLIKNLSQNNITAFEINPENVNQLKANFPNAEIFDKSFEFAFLKEPRYNSLINNKGGTWLKSSPYDLVIANPPYGKYAGFYSSYFSFKGQWEHFFIYYTLLLLKSGGIGVYLIPSSFLRNGIDYNEIKNKIFDVAKLTDAYRLPSNIFKDTQIGTDILVLTKK